MKRFLVFIGRACLFIVLFFLAPGGLAMPAHAEQAQAAPQFESFMVNNDDGMVEISGRAAGFSHVELVDGAVILGEVGVTQEGLFRIRLADRLKPGEYLFVLRSMDEQGRSATSLQTLMVSIPEPGNGKALALVEEPGKARRLISAPKAPRQDAQPARRDFTIDTIAYKNGKLTVCGKRPAGLRVSITSRNRTIGIEKISDTTDFCIVRTHVMETGDYIFRAELTDASGSRMGVVSLPFSIEKAGVATRQVYRAGHPVDTVVVRKGDTLSHIARRVYGDSSLANALFEANRDRIRSPCEIYAGQELVLPLAKKQKKSKKFP